MGLSQQSEVVTAQENPEQERCFYIAAVDVFGGTGTRPGLEVDEAE